MPKKEPLVRWTIKLPSSTARLFESIFFDPMTAKPTYGIRSRTINKLLLDYMARLPEGTKPDLSDLDLSDDDDLDAPSDEGPF